MKYRDRLYGELSQIDADVRRTSGWVLIAISCLALLFACTVAFGGLHV